MRYVFVVRHGERADQAPETRDEWRGHPDAFLVPRGHQQAAETAAWLKSELQQIETTEGRSIDQVFLSCSPFERCMATSSKVGAALGITDIPINYRYCEFMATFLYNENPVPKLGLRVKGVEALKESAGI